MLLVLNSLKATVSFSNNCSVLCLEASQWLSNKESACTTGTTAGDASLIPGSGRSPGEGNGNPRQCSSLDNPIDRGAWWAIVHRSQELDMT